MILYNNFFRSLVLRKKSDIVNPKYYLLGEIELPRESLVVFAPTHPEQYGPSNEEPLISTYPDQINISFNNEFRPVLGKTLENPFNPKKYIDAYRGSHFRYKWARNPGAAISRKQELFIENNALGQLRYRYQLNRFTAFDRAYNQLFTTVDVINQSANNYPTRQLFLRIELPPSVPNYMRFEQELPHYLKAFNEDGTIKGINDQAIKTLKAYGAFWLWDWFLFLTGDLKHSQFGRLSAEALERLHLVFSFRGTCIIIKPGMIKDWLDELSKPDLVKTPMRINATKRFLLIFINLIKNQEKLVTSKVEVEHDGDETETTAESIVEEQAKDLLEEAKRRSVVSETEEEEGSDTNGDNSRTLDDILMGNKRPVPALDGVGLESDEPVTDGADEDDSWTDELSEQDQLSEAEEQDITDPETTSSGDDKIAGVERALQERAKNGNLTIRERDFFIKQANSYKTIKMENGQTLEEFIKIDDKVLSDINEPVAPEIVGLSDPSMVESRTMNFRNEYAKKVLDKDVAAMILGVQKGGIALTGLKTETVTNISGSFKVYGLSLHHPDGSPSNRQFRIPVVDEFGSYRVDGQNRVKATQRMDLPIRKLDDYRVGLTSYYGIKLIVSRNRMNANDRYLKISKEVKLKGQGTNPRLSYQVGNMVVPDMKLPRAYTGLAKYFKTINIGNFKFDFDILKFSKLKSAEINSKIKQGTPPCGHYGKELMFVDEYGNVTSGDKNLGTIEEILEVTETKLPVDFAQINIRGFQFPIGVVLSYFYGFDDLLKRLKIKPRIVPVGERPALRQDEFALTFADEYVIFDGRDPMSALVFGGMRKLDNLSNFNRFDMNSEGVWVPVIGNAKVKPGHFKEMRLMYDMFIDPVTGEKLRKMGYSDNFGKLLIEATELLIYDQHRHEVEIEEQRLICYEMFAGIVYNELVNATRQFRNKSPDKRNTVDLNPDIILAKIVSDTATDGRQDVNPIHEIKDQETVTFGGTYGRSEVSMVRRTRGQLPSYAGVISEAGKDSGKIGFVGYLTSNAKIADLRGSIDTSIDGGEAGIGSVSMNLMYGALIDDPKRQLFSGVQHSQATSAVNYQPAIVSTGYDRVIAHRTSELYSKPAKQDGKVTSVNKYGLVVTYKDGSEDTYALGLELGKAAGETHRHNRVTDLKEGDTFKKGDILGWDEVYFERDLPYNPRQVIWKCGVMGRIALIENQFTFEDSIEISSTFAKACRTSYPKEKDFFINFEDGVEMLVSIGSEVDQDSILCNVIDSSLLGLVGSDSEAAGLDRMGMKQHRANHFGKVVMFDVQYNGDPELMSESLRAFVLSQDKRLKDQEKMTKTGIKSGNIAGNLNIGRSPIEPGTVKVTVYIEEFVETVLADKFVIGNQMKGTVGNVSARPIVTVDGRVVDIVFSLKSLFSRMVLSLRDKLIGGELSRHVKAEFIRIYRGK